MEEQKVRYWQNQAFKNSVDFMWEIRTLATPYQQQVFLSSHTF